MKHPYDISIMFIIQTPTDEYSEQFSSDWRYKEMYDYMIARFQISEDSIHTIQQNYIKRFKQSK